MKSVITLLFAFAAIAAAQETATLSIPKPEAVPAAEESVPKETDEPADEQPDTAPQASAIDVAPPNSGQRNTEAHAAVDAMREAFVKGKAPAQNQTGAPVLEPASPLDNLTPQFRISEQPIGRAVRLLGRPHRVSFVVEPDAAETVVSADMTDATVRECLLAITEPYGLFHEERAGYVSIRRNKTEFFFIEYPSMSRTSSGSVSVNLAAAQSQSGGGVGGQGVQGGFSSQTGGLGASGSAQSQQQDAATLSIEKDNDSDLWDSIETEINSQLGEGETLTLNRFSGIATVTASPRRLERIGRFIQIVNRRINRQVHIQARILEIDLTDQQKLGVDWTQALTAAGNGSGDVTFEGEALTNLNSIGPETLAPNTFGLRIGAGKLNAVVSALSEQGDVRTESEPRVTTLTNQTTYIKIGEDRTFFSLTSSTSINQGDIAGGGSNVTSQDIYSRFTQTFGNVLEVTPSVSEDGIITLIASPVISRLKSITTSPDGKQSGPDTDSKATESIIRLRSGETGVMGGFVFTQTIEGTRGVPVLQSVPLFGRAFRTDATHKTRSEIVILITATLDPL